MLFQNTTASRPKLFPVTVITNGVLLTGTVLGASDMSAGGVKLVPKPTFGSRMDVPQPTLRMTANPTLPRARNSFPGRSRKVGHSLAERITASLEMASIVLLFGLAVVISVAGIPRPARHSGWEFAGAVPRLACNKRTRIWDTVATGFFSRNRAWSF